MEFNDFKKRLDLAIEENSKHPKNYSKIAKVLHEVKKFEPVKNMTSAN